MRGGPVAADDAPYTNARRITGIMCVALGDAAGE